MQGMKWRDQVVVVTGASSGIGTEFARLVAARGAKLVLVARSQDRLEALVPELEGASGHRPIVIGADLSDVDEAHRVCDEISARGLSVEHLINNAGVGYAASVATSDVARLVGMVQLNCTALTVLTARLLPQMVQRGSGGMLQVASMVALYPAPYMAAYAASKAYVKSFSEALSVELAGKGVTVSALCPGQVPTGFQRSAGFSNEEIPVPGALSAEMTARLGLHGYEKGKVVYVPGLLNKVGAFFMALLPRAIVARISASALRKLGRFD